MAAADEERRAREKEDEAELKHRRYVLVSWLITVCPVYEHMYQSPLAPHLPALLPQLLMTIADKDRSLSKQAQACTEYVANTPMLSSAVLPQVLSTAEAMLVSTSWHVRAAVLPFLQTLLFRHQFVLHKGDMGKVRELVLRLLCDSQVEVREMASLAVSVLVRISGDELALSLQGLFRGWCAGPLPKQVKGAEGVAAMNLRHAGVLGLAALVGAHPYDVPEWMPAILVKLASHINEPMPVKQTVKNTFGEFWRTHQDAWTQHKDKFAEDELSALTDLLVSPTYFS